MTDPFTPDIRDQIAMFLPQALENAIQSYDEFLKRKEEAADNCSAEETEERKKERSPSDDFKKHHDACKVALAHMELILKMADKAGLESSVEDKRADFLRLLSEAQTELDEMS